MLPVKLVCECQIKSRLCSCHSTIKVDMTPHIIITFYQTRKEMFELSRFENHP